eukprot:1437726-Rhodomonas_salina.1
MSRGVLVGSENELKGERKQGWEGGSCCAAAWKGHRDVDSFADVSERSVTCFQGPRGRQRAFAAASSAMQPVAL